MHIQALLSGDAAYEFDQMCKHIWPILRGSSISGTHYAQRTRRAHLNYFTASNVTDRLNYNCTAEHGTSFVAQSISFTS